MLQFTYAHTHRTTPFAVLCVGGVHALTITALLWHANVPDLDNQQSIAMEMVLAPVSATTQSSVPKVTPHPAPAVPTSPTSNTPTAEAPTPTAAPAQTGRSPDAPALTLPSSEAHGLNNPKPAYPRQSRRLNEQGHVVIRVFVTADGSPQQGEINTSSGYDRLDQEALRTVLRWRFAPGQRLGVPEAMWFNVPVHFVLE